MPKQALLVLLLIFTSILPGRSTSNTINSTHSVTTCDNATNGGQIEGDEIGCPNPVFDPSLITNVIFPSGGSGNLEYIWIYTTIDPLQPVSLWVPIPGSNASEYDPGPITQTTWYRRCARREGCDDYVAESNYVVKEIYCCDNYTSGGEIGNDQESCLSSFDPALLENITNPSGGSGNGVFTWYSSTIGPPFDPNTWQMIPGADQLTYDPGIITATTWFIRFARRAECAEGIPSNIVKVELLPGVSISGVIEPVSCFGGNNGSINVTISGGSPGFTFTWSTGATTEDLSGLNIGTYSVTVTDINGCSNSALYTVSEPDLLSLVVQGHNPTCFGASDGSISLIVEGGTPPYSFNWDNAPDVQNPINLGAGTYAVTVTDYKGCVAHATLMLADPPVIDIGATIIQPNCEGGSTGSIGIVITGGIPGYSVLWNTGATTTLIDGLAAGVYSVTITDSNNCVGTGSYILQDPDGLMASGTIHHVSCNGLFDGGIEIVVSNGEAPFTYNWSNGSNDQNQVGLEAGSYTLTISDVNGCPFILMFVVQQPDSIQITFSKTDVDCFGGNDGTATAIVSGGTAPYTYSWNTNPVQTTATATNLLAGTYTVIVTDANNCTATGSVTIIAPPALTITMSKTDVDCFGGNDGTATAIVSGGTAPYTYSWNTNPVQTTATATNLEAGTYPVIVTDANNCTATGSVTIIAPPALTISLSKTDVDCFGGNDGIATANVSGGTAPYTYSWNTNPVQTTATATNLVAGTYTVIVTDANNCTATGSVTIIAPPALTITLSKTDVDCFGGNDGTATASVSGGTAPYTYSWNTNPVQTTATATNLLAGTYTVIVTDANNCTATGSVTIIAPPALIITLSKTDVDCFGGNDGTATASVSGGTAPYTYSWNTNPVQTTATATNLVAGIYTVIVTDANNCTATGSVTIIAPPALTISLSKTDVDCFGGNDGTATANVSGGTAPFTYSWNTNPVQTTALATNLVAGTYTVIVTDANDCTATGSVTVFSPTIVELTISNVDQTCIQKDDGMAEVIANGGSSPYTYQWNDLSNTTNAKVNNLAPGTYMVTVMDAKGCTAVGIVEIDASLEECDCLIRKGDFVWYDFDKDGIQDANELGVNGIPVHLVESGPDGEYGTEDDIKIKSTITSGSGFNTGYYMFENVCAGTYAICFEIDTALYLFSPAHQGLNPAVDSDADPLTGCTDPFTITANSSDDLTWDAGIQDYCVNVEDPGEIGYDQTICYGEIPDLIGEVQPPQGGSGDLEYLWLKSEVEPIYYPGNNYWEEIPNSNTPDYQPGNLLTTTYYLRCVRRAGCSEYLESNIITVTVIDVDATILNGYFDPICVDKGYIFQAKSNGQGATYFWTFGPDGIPSAATSQIVHPVKWPTVGPKTVTLTVTLGNCVETTTVEYVADVCACKPAFLDFDAVVITDSLVEVKWSADTWEQDHVFLIERSLDGLDFEYIATVTGVKDQVKQYQIHDKDPYKGESFYRIKLIDMLGNKDMTQAERVFILNADAFYLDFFPNPSSQSLWVRFHEPTAGGAVIQFFDIVGKQIHTQEIKSGARIIEINCASWIDGTYIAYLFQDGKRPISLKFIKTR